MPISEELLKKLRELQHEATRVGDSPSRADQLAAKVAALSQAVASAEASEEIRARVRTALGEAERVLRRDDDGHEASRRLQNALREAEERPRRPPPF
ncbi:MAG TPA: hypothetical protein VFL93_09585 [Longimicrobiaceae bacterium]|nr:hypothetical protein [Longimicrobiaceae bacterium]